jgi:large subunit ribosomal protein L24
MQIKKGDKVIILTGKDKGKSGTVSRAMPKDNKVIIDGLNLVKRHKKARKQGEKGTIVEVATPINASNVKKA